MPRDLSRRRSNLGSGDSVSTPKVDETNIQPTIDQIYKELNRLKASLGNNAKGSASTPKEGKDGDIRLFSEHAEDGSLGYFISGKFGESWASGRLSLDLIKPRTEYSEGAPSIPPSYDDDGGGYITKKGVTYENLDSNQDVGSQANQVARGSHIHDHDSDFITNTGNNTHAQIDSHILDTSIHSEPGVVSEMAKVDNDTASAGSIEKWARIDHAHVLDQTQTYTFSAQQNFNNPSGTAISAVGDVSIDGNLYVNFAEAAGGNTTIDNSLDVGLNVDLNDSASNLSGNTNTVNTTTIRGATTLYNELTIEKGLSTGEKHITIRTGASNAAFTIDVNQNGLPTLSADNGTEAIDIQATALRPGADLSYDLGQPDKRWRSIHAGELIVETLVAQDVMATIGGRIIVAPTTKLIASISSSYTSLDVEHDIFEAGDIGYMQKGTNAGAQFEAIKIISAVGALPTGAGYRYIIQRDIDGGGANAWSVDDAIVNFGYEIGDGFIDMTATQSVYSNQGPVISLHARGVQGSDWQVPEVARLGNFSGTGYTGSNDFGVMVGSNLENGPQATTDPFKGLIGNADGLQLINSEVKIYDGSNLQVFIGKDSNDKNMLAIGDQVNEDTGAGADLLFKYDATAEAHVLTVTGNIDLSGSDLTNLDLDISSSDIMDAIDHFHPNTNNPNTSGFYLTPRWAGFYQQSGAYWPVKLGATSNGDTGEPFVELKNAATNPTEYLRYTVNNGLEIAAKITIVDEEAPKVIAHSSPQFSYTQNGASPTLNYAHNCVEGDIIRVYYKGTDLETGIRPEFTLNANANPTITWQSFANSFGGTNNATEWFEYTYVIPENPSAVHAIRTYRFHEDGGTLHAMIVVKNRPIDPETVLQSLEAIPGNSDYTTSNDITLGSGSIEIGNATTNTGIYSYGKDNLLSSTPGFYLGNAPTDATQFGINIGNASQFLKYESVNGTFDIKGANLLVQNSDGVVNIGEDLEDAGPVNSILIGKFDQQTIDADNNTVDADHGVLVNHENSKDYTLMSKKGFVRRGYSYPILIHDDVHWGGPVGVINSNNENGCTGTFAPNYFGHLLSYGQPGNWADSYSYPLPTKGSKISHFWDYDYSYVPSGRKLTWTFEIIAIHRGGHNGETAYSNYSELINRIDFNMEGFSDMSNPVSIMHNADSSFAGLESYNYPNSWSSSRKHHFGYRAGGCRTGAYGHTTKWCYHALHDWIPFITSINPGTYVSYGDIPSNTSVQNLYLISGSLTTSVSNNTSYNDSGVNLGRLRIWEVDA